MHYIIIEDEMASCRQLQRIVAQLRPDFHLDCILDTVEESVAYLQQQMPDLIFMDVELGDGTCFDILRDVSIQTPVIFTTAYDKYAIEAFRTHSIDYLLKPLDIQSVENALNKLDSMRIALADRDTVAMPTNPKTAAERILIVKHSSFSYLNIRDIAFLKFEDRYIAAYTMDGKSEITELKNIEEAMTCVAGYDFFQLSRGVIASIRSIKNVKKIDNHRLEVSIGNANEVLMTIPISFQRRRAFLQWLGK